MKKPYVARIMWKHQDVCETVPVLAHSIKEAKHIAMTYVYSCQGMSNQKKKWVNVWPMTRWWQNALQMKEDGSLV